MKNSEEIFIRIEDCPPPLKPKRIEYIDAMRGFTMILVVLSHVSIFGLGLIGATDVTSYHTFLGQFCMPLFFFVSGFVLFKSGFDWSVTNSFSFIKRKISVQIISPFLFLLTSVIVHQNLVLLDCLMDSYKAGYWFTFTLFEYYILYILIHVLTDTCKLRGYVKDVLFIFIGLGFYAITVPTMVEKWPLSENMRGFIGVVQLGYFFFFVLGTRIRKYFSLFEKALECTPLIMICVIVFFGFNICYSWISAISSTGFHLLTSVSGLIVVFALFRQEKEIFSQSHRVGQILQYIGRRTLDIYLIHYFFIFSNMQAVLPNFAMYNSPFLEFLLSSILTVFVISASLIISRILRMSPFMAHFLFGKKTVIKG